MISSPLNGGNTISIYLNTGRQALVLDQQLLLYGYAQTATSLTISDFNGDGLQDINHYLCHRSKCCSVG
jgi:hypothetical protein